MTMFYSSLQLFLNCFCESTECSSKEGMEFVLDSRKVRNLTSAHHVWLTISPDFSQLTILMVFDTGAGEIEVKSSFDIMQATFERVIQEIEEMSLECALQD